jgi:hypothetical protein
MYSVRSESPLLQDPGCTRVILALYRMVVQTLEVIILERNSWHLCCAIKLILTFGSKTKLSNKRIKASVDVLSAQNYEE